jgi:hypothetical protein
MNSHCSTYNILDATSFGKEFVLTPSMLRRVNSTLNDKVSAAKVAVKVSKDYYELCLLCG